jgi:glycine cleavage system H protein
VATVEGYEFPDDRWYDPLEHLWVLDAGGLVTVGVDALGAERLGEVVYVQLGAVGAEVARGAALGSLEAEKMVRPVLAPVSGRVVAVNDAVLAAPGLLNRDPYGAGWLLRLAPARWAEERAGLLRGEAAVAAWARRALEADR